MSQVEEEKAYYVSRWGVKGLQAGCIAAIPIYAIQTIRKGNFSLRGLARYNWTVPLVGGTLGASYGLTTASTSNPTTIIAKSNELRFDSNRVRMDDLHLIGGAVGALLLPAIFLRRVGLINGLLGGAGLGGTVGVVYHGFQKYGARGLADKGEKLADEAQGWGEKAWKKGQEKVEEGKSKVEKEMK